MDGPPRADIARAHLMATTEAESKRNKEQPNAY